MSEAVEKNGQELYSKTERKSHCTFQERNRELQVKLTQRMLKSQLHATPCVN